MASKLNGYSKFGFGVRWKTSPDSAQGRFGHAGMRGARRRGDMGRGCILFFSDFPVWFSGSAGFCVVLQFLFAGFVVLGFLFFCPFLFCLF
jgi:hypothetical protein